MPDTPLFSVVVPLEFHRGQWERGWRAWQAQSLAPSLYETLLVVPPGFPEREQLVAMLGPNDRLVDADSHHDIGLCAVGAARARGRFLFFTESHCWPEPDVLELCQRAFERHPEWSAFSCQSVRIAHNRYSHAEADMYEADIEHGLQRHPWRKVLDQCFVTRRESFLRCGGLRPELGHFAEWVLAANYFALGQAIGYVPEARLHHFYVGRMDELRNFTQDFIDGEMRYFRSPAEEPGRELLEMPREWIGQGNLDPALARSLLRLTLRELLQPSRARPLRWLLPALGGSVPARAGAAVQVGLARAAAVASRVAASRATLCTAFRNYIAALIHQQRLRCLAAEGAARPASEGFDLLAPQNAGFHPIETWRGRRFRWSETAAIVRGALPAGSHRLRIECLPVRPVLDARPRLALDGRPVPPHDLVLRGDAIELRVEAQQPAALTLAWTCTAFTAPGDGRRLGLPVERITWRSETLEAKPGRGRSRLIAHGMDAANVVHVAHVAHLAQLTLSSLG